MSIELPWYHGMRVRLRRPERWLGAGRNLAAILAPHSTPGCPGRTCRNPECGPVVWTDELPEGTVGTIVRHGEPTSDQAYQFVPDDPYRRAADGTAYLVTIMTDRSFEVMDEPLVAVGKCAGGASMRGDHGLTCIVKFPSGTPALPNDGDTVTITWRTGK